MKGIRKATLIEKHAALAYDLRQRINPLYAEQRGTESYERRECAEAIEELIREVEILRCALTDADNDLAQTQAKLALHLEILG